MTWAVVSASGQPLFLGQDARLHGRGAGRRRKPAGVAGGDLAPPPDPGDEDAIAHLSYTSGTSGRSKGVCLAHEPTMRATRCIAERLRLTSTDSCFGPTALSSSYQLVANLLPGLHRVATVNVMGRWTPETGWDAMEVTGATAFAANPTLLSDVLTEFRKRGCTPGRLRYGLSGGGPVPAALKKAWRDELRLPLIESYGQSELGGFVGLGYPEFELDERLGAVGPALPDKEVRIFGDDAQEAGSAKSTRSAFAAAL